MTLPFKHFTTSTLTSVAAFLRKAVDGPDHPGEGTESCHLHAPNAGRPADKAARGDYEGIC
ncbi:MAG: hypothetical protein AAFQ19_00225 [Pseudomonadota bacterium]